MPMMHNGLMGVWIEQMEIKKINHRLVEGLQCKENLDSLTTSYKSLQYHYDLQSEIIDMQELRLENLQHEKRISKFALYTSISISFFSKNPP